MPIERCPNCGGLHVWDFAVIGMAVTSGYGGFWLFARRLHDAVMGRSWWEGPP